MTRCGVANDSVHRLRFRAVTGGLREGGSRTVVACTTIQNQYNSSAVEHTNNNRSLLNQLNRLRDQNKRSQLEMIEGPRRIDQTSETETPWGVPRISTTQQAAGTAAVLSVQSGAAVVYVRQALTTFFDPYSRVANNIYQFVAETRLALATPRPGATNLVSGLPTS